MRILDLPLGSRRSDLQRRANGGEDKVSLCQLEVDRLPVSLFHLDKLFLECF
jgi:hypothetical protein